MKQEDKDKIIQALEEKNAKLPCPRCGNQQFTLVDGYSTQSIQDQIGGVVLGGPAVPFITVVCSNCGFLSHHALGALGLLPHKDDSNNENK